MRLNRKIARKKRAPVGVGRRALRTHAVVELPFTSGATTSRANSANVVGIVVSGVSACSRTTWPD